MMHSQNIALRWLYTGVWGWILLMTVLGGCRPKAPIKVGFVGSLTGRVADLGVAGRNGVILAVEQINAVGGIHNHPVELLIKDDQHDPEIAVRVDQELIEAGVVAIIGHMTSAMSIAAVPLMNQEKILMISPTSSTDELTGLDDFFVRITPPSSVQSEHLARYAFETLGLRKIACVYDLSNQAFTEGWYRNFNAVFKGLGGESLLPVAFHSATDVSYFDLVNEILADEIEGIVIVTSALDAAMICQQVRKLGAMVPIIAGGWAKTPDFIQHGGAAVEGVLFSQTFDGESQHERYQRFKVHYLERFGGVPDFPGAFGYEAAQILFEALARVLSTTNYRAEDLKAAIVNHTFQGLQGELTMDAYGDIIWQRTIVTVKNGQFITLE